MEQYPEGGILASTVGAWLRMQREEEGPRPTACGTPLRGSQARVCARRVAFEVAQMPVSNEKDTTTLIAFRLGTAMHDFCQAAMGDLFSDLEAEAVVDLRPMGFDVSGHADWVYTMGEVSDGDSMRPRRLVGELKTMKAYPFKLAIREGAPKLEHIAQAAIYAIGLKADGIHMVYLSKETGQFRDDIKPGQVLEWVYAMDDVVNGQTVFDIGMTELIRLQGIWEQVQDGVIPARDIPGYGLVESPPPFQGKGDPWNCRFCDFRETCNPLPTEAVPVGFSSQAVQDTWNPPTGTEVAA